MTKADASVSNEIVEKATNHAGRGFFNIAGAEGFEPTNGGSKNRCLTAWRRPS